VTGGGLPGFLRGYSQRWREEWSLVQRQGHPCPSPRGKFDSGEEDFGGAPRAERSDGAKHNAFPGLSEVGSAFERRPWTKLLSGRNNEKIL
jgi:hypothetical protein